MKSFWEYFFEDLRKGDRVEIQRFRNEHGNATIVDIERRRDGRIYWILFDDGFGCLAFEREDLKKISPVNKKSYWLKKDE